MTAADAARGFVNAFNQAFLFPLIALLMALAFLVFLWGCFEYIRNAGNDEGRKKGQSHIMYGTIGMLVMLSAYAILNLAAGTFGIDVGRIERIESTEINYRNEAWGGGQPGQPVW